MFAYPDAARYRVGVNYQQLPTNAPKAPVYCPFERDGAMNFSGNYGADPNYVGSSLKPTKFYQELKGLGPMSISTLTEHEKWVGEVTNFQTHVTDEDFEQATALWEVLGKEPGHQERFFGNVAAHLNQVKNARLRSDVYGAYSNTKLRGYTFVLKLMSLLALFSRVSPELGSGIKKATEALISG